MENELFHMIDVVTTNKTDFFREKVHFDYLVTTAVPELLVRYGTGSAKKLLIWSAGCSTGEEPYTIAMVLKDSERIGQDFQFEVVATDISTKVCGRRHGEFTRRQGLSTIPMVLRQKYLMRSKDKEKRLVRIVPELRRSCSIQTTEFHE